MLTGCARFGKCPEDLCPGCSTPPKFQNYQVNQQIELFRKLRIPYEVTLKDGKVLVEKKGQSL